MKRIDGNLVFEYNDNYSNLIKNGSINELPRHRVSFYFNNNLFFKEEENVYYELVGSKIARYLGIRCVNYDLARVVTTDKEFKGVVSNSFLEDGYRIVSFAQIFEEYEDKETDKEMSLEFIWEVLLERYKDYDNCEEIVKNIMSELVDYFLLDLLIGNIDNGKYNYQLMENGKIAKCCPYYDFERTFIFKNTRFTVSKNDDKDIYFVLDKYLSESDSVFGERFISMYNKLTPEKLEEIFILVEKDIDYKLPDNFKNILYLSYSRHYYKIRELLSRDKFTNYKKK